MVDRVADHVGALVRCLSLHLNRKVTGVIAVLLNQQACLNPTEFPVDLLLHDLGAGSLGAIAGFAIAVLFAWMFLRPSPGRQANDRRKRWAAPSTSRLAGGLEPSGSGGLVPTGSLNGTVAVEAITSPAEVDISLSLGQIVKQRLGGCGKITCQLLGVILDEKTPEELQKHATVRLSVLQIVEEISKYFDLFLMETVLDDESEEKVLSALENAGIFQNGSLIKDKVYWF
ncbi:hypothetical protein C4D60_Mb01t18200 [Musa balbisiana]|uniref:Uncharacterized protein n=1 Tax=Musa balbisiana TaxID=52838 RepID=A0A4S8JQ22_MUSBA|nr:hypothetical protein C4D60_Mb01t18200 [Musa balbisiana]